MSSIDGPTPAAVIARAAGLLDAVARDSEAAVDFEVPIRCGQAANRLYALLGAASPAVPYVGDTVDAIQSALSEAITLLSSLPPDEVPESVGDALVQARAATRAATQNEPGR